jgi:hypothetical protein
MSNEKMSLEEQSAYDEALTVSNSILHKAEVRDDLETAIASIRFAAASKARVDYWTVRFILQYALIGFEKVQDDLDEEDLATLKPLRLDHN